MKEWVKPRKLFTDRTCPGASALWVKKPGSSPKAEKGGAGDSAKMPRAPTATHGGKKIK